MIDEQFRNGIRKALKMQGTNPGHVSVKAGYNRNLLRLFLNGNNGISLMTLDSICRKGLDMTFNDVLILGQMEK